MKIADVNPIHMAAWCAKLFGFRSNIAHGMLLMARFVQAAQATGMNLDGCVYRSSLNDCSLHIFRNYFCSACN